MATPLAELGQNTEIDENSNGETIIRNTQTGTEIRLADFVDIVGALGDSSNPVAGTSHFESVSTPEVSHNQVSEAVMATVEDQIVVAAPGEADVVQFFDPTSNDAGQAFNDAWSAAANGGTVYLPGGVYTGTTTIVPQGSGVEFQAVGRHSITSPNAPDAAIGFVYEYQGTGRGFDLGAAGTVIAGCELKGFGIRLSQDTGLPIWDFRDRNSNGSGWRESELDLYADATQNSYGDEGFKLGKEFYRNKGKLTAVHTGGDGIEHGSGNANKLYLDVMYADGFGVELNGGKGCQFYGNAYDTRNGNPNIRVGSVDGGLISMKAEDSDAEGFLIESPQGTVIQAFSASNDEATPDGDYGIKWTGGKATVYARTQESGSGAGNSLRIASTASGTLMPGFHDGTVEIEGGDGLEILDKTLKPSLLANQEGSNVSLPATTWEPINLSANVIENVSIYNKQTENIDPPGDGLYYVNAQASFNVGSDGDRLQFRLYNVTDSVLIVSSRAEAGGSDPQEVQINGRFELQGGKSYQFQALNADSSDTVSGSVRTFASVELDKFI